MGQDSGKWSLNKWNIPSIPRQTDPPTEMRGSRYLTCWDAWKNPELTKFHSVGKIYRALSRLYILASCFHAAFSSAVLETYISSTQTHKNAQTNQETKKMSRPQQACFKRNTKIFVKRTRVMKAMAAWKSNRLQRCVGHWVGRTEAPQRLFWLLQQLQQVRKWRIWRNTTSF